MTEQDIGNLKQHGERLWRAYVLLKLGVVHSTSQVVSTSQRAVTPCGWGVKAGMVCVWVAGKTVWSPRYTRPISECLSIIRRYTNHQITLTLTLSNSEKYGLGRKMCKISERAQWTLRTKNLSEVGTQSELDTLPRIFCPPIISGSIQITSLSTDTGERHTGLTGVTMTAPNIMMDMQPSAAWLLLLLLL